ncbi:MAG: hypothetical protein LBJ18_03510 [Rickettsiales bacterium]|jgi:hypothetical protein|nr:hypothetical protein [Rickettsiales bacterium]
MKKVFVFLIFISFVAPASAIGTCNNGYAYCTAFGAANVACSNCSGGYTGRYGYVDFGGNSCCIDTWASEIGEFAISACTDGICHESCSSTTYNNKHYCSKARGPKDPATGILSCSANVIAAQNPCEPQNYYKCTDGYIWAERRCNSATTNYGEYCSCKVGCRINEYDEYGSGSCEQCPVAGFNQYGEEQYGYSVPDQDIYDEYGPGYSIEDCNIWAGSSYYDNTGLYTYTDSCWYSPI